MKNILFLFTFFLTFINPELLRGHKPYIFRHFSTADGLLNNEVKSILRDRCGFLWIGTAAGLNRYDGYRLKSYVGNPQDTYSLLEDDIESLQEDIEGNIWIGGRNTYVLYKREHDCFVSVQSLLEQMQIHSKENVSLVHVDTNGDVWVIIGDTLYHYQYERAGISYSALKRFPLPRKTGTACLSDDGVHLYLVNNEGNVYEFNIAKGIWKQLPSPANAIGINRVYRDKSAGLWLYSTQNDAVYYKKDGEERWKAICLESEERLQSNFIRSIQDDGKGNIWIATDHKGLFLYNKGIENIVNILHDPLQYSSITENGIGCMHWDSQGVLWVGYIKKGLSCYHPSFQKISNYQEPFLKNISAILEDSKGRVWIGTDGYGLVYKYPDSVKPIQKVDIPGNIVVTLMEDSRGRIWIGTYLHGLLCYENGKLKQYTTANSGLADNSVYTLKQDRLGKIWIGTLWGHLQCLHPDSGIFENYISPSKDNSIAVSMHYENGDTLYVGMISGLCLQNIKDGRQQMYFGNKRGTMRFKQAYIQSVYKDEKGNFWLGHNQGVTVWDVHNDTLYYLDRKDGLCDNVVRGIAKDNRHRIWITTSNGCSIVNVYKRNEGKLSFHMDSYSTKDGLATDNFSRHSLCFLQSNRMLLGGVDGYSLVDLAVFDEKKDTSSQVIFTGLRIGGYEIQPNKPYQGRIVLKRTIEQQKELELKYFDRLIQIEYTAMNLLAPNRIHYAYMLEGLNKEWFYTTDTQITFNSLPPGNYRLLIKATNGTGQWHEDVSALFIRVLPPFWLSWYAYLFYAFSVALFFYFLWKHLQRKHLLHLEQHRAQLEHEQAIRLNEMKLRFFTNISHDFRTPLTLIITPLQTVLQEMTEGKTKESLKAVYRNAESLLTLINQLLDFRKLDVGGETLHLLQGDFAALFDDVAQNFQSYAAERCMNFHVCNEIGTLMMSFDADKVRKILANLLSNAFKYTPNGGTVTLRLFREGEQVGVSVADTGIGIQDADKKHIFERFFQIKQKMEFTGSGIGLHIVNEYVRMHQGCILVSDNEPQGCIFTFLLPIVAGKQSECLISKETDGTLITIKEEIQKDENSIPTLLFVEDNREFCNFMSDNLKQKFHVLIAENGKKALEVLEKEDVNIVICDVMMPVMDGMELCKRIKSDIRTSHIPVILLTARTAEEYRLEGLEQGADDYITKPFSFNMLLLRIHKFMEWTEKSHQTFRRKLDVSPSEITITSLDEQLIAKAIRIVEEHMDDSDFSVETLSEEVGLTRGHLYKKLVSITGQGPADFIRTIRLKRAKQMLEESQLQIAEIAYSVGFSSPKIFSKNFKAEYGISPSEYVKTRK